MTEFHYYTLYNFRLPFHIRALIVVIEITTCNHVYMGGQVKLQRPRYNLTQLHWYRYIVHPPYGIPRSLDNMTATNAEKVAAVVQRQNAQQRSVLLRVLRDCCISDHCSLCRRLTYLAAAAAITCVAAVPFLGLQYSRRERRQSLVWTRL